MNRFVFATAALSFALASTAIADVSDSITIGVSLDAPDQSALPGSYRVLRGQSAYLSFRTANATSGGQLDGWDSNTGFGEITFTEVFPESNLTDYLTFGYFGVVETYTLEEDDDGNLFEVLSDQSVIVGAFGSFAVGASIQDVIPGLDEATLLNALLNSFDSPEFFQALDAVGSDPGLQATIGLVDSTSGTPQEIRGGENLRLISFSGGIAGEEGIDVGYLYTTVSRVPAPGAITVLTLAGLAASRRRRS